MFSFLLFFFIFCLVTYFLFNAHILRIAELNLIQWSFLLSIFRCRSHGNEFTDVPRLVDAAGQQPGWGDQMPRASGCSASKDKEVTHGQTEDCKNDVLLSSCFTWFFVCIVFVQILFFLLGSCFGFCFLLCPYFTLNYNILHYFEVYLYLILHWIFLNDLILHWITFIWSVISYFGLNYLSSFIHTVNLLSCWVYGVPSLLLTGLSFCSPVFHTKWELNM